MSKPIKSVPDPIFNDFLYTVLFNMSAPEKRGLHGKYLKAAMSEKSAKAFIQNATDEDKKYILSHAGYKFYWVLQKDNFKAEYLREILTKFESSNHVSALRDIAHQGIFVTAEKEFLRLLGLMSSAIHQSSFYFDLSMLRTGWHIKSWKKRFFNPRDMEAREVDESSNEIAKLIFASSVTMDYAKAQSGISPEQMKILLYLYTESHRKMSDSYLGEYFTGYMNKTGLRVAIKTLLKNALIESDTGQKERSYTITGKGIRAVSEFFKTVFSKLNK